MVLVGKKNICPGPLKHSRWASKEIPALFLVVSWFGEDVTTWLIPKLVRRCSLTVQHVHAHETHACCDLCRRQDSGKQSYVIYSMVIESSLTLLQEFKRLTGGAATSYRGRVSPPVALNVAGWLLISNHAQYHACSQIRRLVSESFFQLLSLALFLSFCRNCLSAPSSGIPRSLVTKGGCIGNSNVLGYY